MKPWILERAARTPGAPALVVDGRSLPWFALAERARGLAAALAARGVGPGDRVAALLGNDPAFVELLHAAPLLGAVVVPLHVRLPASERVRQLEETGARLVLVPDAHGDGAAAPALDGAPCSRVTPEELGYGEGAGQVPPHALGGAGAALVVYTSGTSGVPRGVVLTHHNLLASAIGSALHLGALPSDRWLACVPLFHVAGIAILVRSVLCGAAVVLHERFDAEAVSRALDEQGVTMLSLVPTMLARLLDARGDRPPPPTLRGVLLGGAATPAPLLERALAAGWPLLPTYGMTETASQVATLPPGARPRPDGGGLVPLPGFDVRIVDEAEHPQPAGREGLVEVRGPSVTPGYWNAPAATAEKLRDGWLRTGDRGVLDAAGRLRVLGRADDVVVSGGENVHPAAVEAALLAHPDVADAGVAGLPDPELGARVAAWIVPRPGVRPDLAALERFARERLAGHQIPRAWHVVDALPRNAGGKLLRRALAAPAATPAPET